MRVPYRWVIVFLGGLMGCVAIGAMFSLAVFLEPMSEETGWSRAGISTAMTLDFLVMGVAGFLWGTRERPLGAAAGRADRGGAARGRARGRQPGDEPARPSRSASGCWSACRPAPSSRR